jgi:hypothetical protein
LLKKTLMSQAIWHAAGDTATAPLDSVSFCLPRWEQTFSPGGGATWESNWVVNFERTA